MGVRENDANGPRPRFREGVRVREAIGGKVYCEPPRVGLSNQGEVFRPPFVGVCKPPAPTVRRDKGRELFRVNSFPPPR